MQFLTYILLKWDSLSRASRFLIPFGFFVTIALVMILAMPMIFQSSDAYRLAIRKINDDPQVTMYFGVEAEYELLEVDGFSLGAEDDYANFLVKITSDKLGGSVYISMFKSVGVWKFKGANLFVGNQNPIALKFSDESI